VFGAPYNGKDPLTFVVFGATGDLARKKLYPAFGELLRFGRLPEHILVIGYGRSNYTKESLWKKQSVKVKGSEAEKAKLYERCEYFRGQYDSPEAFGELNKIILEYSGNGPDNRIFFLSVPPTIFAAVCKNLKANCMSQRGFTRIIIEKPFGRDSQSFKELNDVTSSCFAERQLYRIDHYLGKEVIMNFMSQRFANIIFEPMWNNKFIESVEINWQENLGTGGRGGYFDKFGIIRDIMQNHLLQVLMFIAMERPNSLTGEDIVKAKTELLKSIPVLKTQDCVIGQFTSRVFQNYGQTKTEPGYLDDETVPKGSKTPTYALVKIDIDNDRWRGVPFIMKAGKGLNERYCEVRIHFKPADGLYSVPGNTLVMRIQPDEAIYFKVQSKRPGLDMSTLETTVMDLSYRREFQGVRIADAYERAFLNASRGDQSLFVGSSELVEAWRIFTPLLHEIDNGKVEPAMYAFGTTGPKESEPFLKQYNISPPSTWESILLQNNQDAKSLEKLFQQLAGPGNTLHHDQISQLLRQFYDGREVPEKRVEEFLSRLDMNNDGEIDFEEFKAGAVRLLQVEHNLDSAIGTGWASISVPFSVVENNSPQSKLVYKGVRGEEIHITHIGGDRALAYFEVDSPVRGFIMLSPEIAKATKVLEQMKAPVPSPIPVVAPAPSPIPVVAPAQIQSLGGSTFPKTPTSTKKPVILTPTLPQATAKVFESTLVSPEPSETKDVEETSMGTPLRDHAAVEFVSTLTKMSETRNEIRETEQRIKDLEARQDVLREQMLDSFEEVKESARGSSLDSFTKVLAAATENNDMSKNASTFQIEKGSLPASFYTKTEI